MKRKILLLGVAIFVFQMNILAQESKTSEKKAISKTFHSSKKDATLKQSKGKAEVKKEISQNKKNSLIVNSILPSTESKSKEVVFVSKKAISSKKKKKSALIEKEAK